MNTAPEHNTAGTRIHLRNAQPTVQLHTIVKAAGVSAPDHRRRPRQHHELHQMVLDRCLRTDKLSVVEIAGSCAHEDGGPPATAVCVAVSDLLHEGTLVRLAPEDIDDTDSKPEVPEVLKRLLAHLEQDQSVETVKIVALGRPEETQAFLGHLKPEKWVNVSTGVEHSVSRISQTLYLYLVGVHHHQALDQLWPDLMRDADAAVLLARSDRLDKARASARLLTSRNQTFHTVVHLADERELATDQVIDELGLSTTAPVVMIDIHSPTAPIAVLRDLCTTGYEDGAHT